MAKSKDTKEVKTTSALEIAKKAIIKEYGEGVISVLGDHEDLEIDAISTGCVSLDVALGNGGFARGRLYEVFGPNSAGKSTLALSVAMQALLRDLNVCYIDAEHALDPRLVRNMAEVNNISRKTVDSIELIQGFTGDDNLEMAEKLMATGEVAVVVVDSVSSLLPKSMAEKNIGDNFIGDLARLMSKACMRLTPIANRTNTLLIFINQIRHSVGKWGDDRVTSGGEALSFYTSGRVLVEGGESRKSRIIDEDSPNKEVMGHRSKFTIVKNKLAPPLRKAEVDLIYGKGYDFVSEIIDIGIQLGIVAQAGSWFDYSDIHIQGKNKLVNMCREDFKLYKEIKSKVTSGLGIEA